MSKKYLGFFLPNLSGVTVMAVHFLPMMMNWQKSFDGSVFMGRNESITTRFWA
jgi:hypothetical protein